MKQLCKKLFCISALLSIPILQADNEIKPCRISPCFIPRSQGRDKLRQLVGVTRYENQKNMDVWYGNFSVMFEYTRSFRPKDIAQCLFGPSACPVVCCPTQTTATSSNCCDTSCATQCCDNGCDPHTIEIQGSQVVDRSDCAWLADYFYLPTDFKGTINFKPVIDNFIVDLSLYLDLHEWYEGLYFRMHGPIVHSRWDLNFCECVEITGTNSHVPGYFAPDAIPNDQLLRSFTEYACGNAPAPINTNNASGEGCGTINFQPLKFSKLDTCRRKKTGFADLRMEFGWNFHQKEDNSSRFGVNLQAAAPTGSKKQSCYLFDPIIGNANHWELGVGVTAHHVFWRSEDEDKEFALHFDGNVTHLFGAREQRTFDLCRKPNSRYMLAEKLCPTTEDELEDRLAAKKTAEQTRSNDCLTAPTAQFNNEYAPVANLTTRKVKIKYPAQGDIVVMFNLRWNRFSWDLGYNFWGRACEQYRCPLKDCGTCCPSLCDESQKGQWALKGDSRVYGFLPNTVTAVECLNGGAAVALSATQSDATICRGTNAGVTNAAANQSDPLFKQNYGVDNPRFAYAHGFRLTHSPEANNNIDANHIKTSLKPVLLQCDDLSYQQHRGLSHKIFTHFSWSFERDGWIPYLGIGAMGEFAQRESKCCINPCDTSCSAPTVNCKTNSSSSSSSSTSASCCKTDCCKTDCCPTCVKCEECCDTCVKCGLSQWGVWIKGGIQFH